MIKYMIPLCIIAALISTVFAGYYISPIVIPTVTITHFNQTESTTITVACFRGQGIYFHATTVTEEITLYKTTTLVMVRPENITTTTTVKK
jgi:hypothetical protein